MMISIRLSIVLLLAVALIPAWPVRAADVSFNRDIRPILSDNCFACHGPDRNARKADLRLDQREAAIASGAIKPGKPRESELIVRIHSMDPDIQMPPSDSKKQLTAEQRELLTRWIEQSAKYEPHWAFQSIPVSVNIPQPSDPDSRIKNSIDAFVLHSLQVRHVGFAPEVSREKWYRRAKMDLTGLPPTLEELDRFLLDTSPDARSAAVDAMLQSPAYGERMAGDWLDVARYADTFGYQSDRDMHVWPWRDWVIRAFNANLPYDQFITWQTAGDLLPNPTRDQRLATTFNRLHRQTNEGGSTEAEFRAAYVADRVVTNGTAFLGLTLECARCHDHKFDPISQTEFYQLAAFFANIDEHGLYSHFTETAPTPAMLLYEGDQESQHQALLRRVAELEDELASIKSSARKRLGQEMVPELPQAKPDSTFSFEDLTASGDYRPVDGKIGLGIEFGGDDAYSCKGTGQFTRHSPFTFSLWVKPGEHQPREVVLHRCAAAEDASYRGYSLLLDSGHPVFTMIHFWPGNAIRVRAAERLPLGEWSHLTISYDGSSRAAGIRIYLNSMPLSLEAERDNLTRDITYRGEWGDSGGPDLTLGARFRDVGFLHGVIDELQVFNKELTQVEVAGLLDMERAREQMRTNEAARMEYVLARVDSEYQAKVAELLAARIAENELVGNVRQIMTMKELEKRRPTHLLIRGAYDSPGTEVQPGTPAGLLPMDPDWPHNRLGFAKWMTDERNPLVSRVAVNRIWQMFFGRGIVASSSDFGNQGQLPTHPELLDWLARRFIESGWNVKELCKLIVLSATYCQSSVPTDRKWYEEDPENARLARGPRHRLSAEQIRDNALAVSGRMVTALGGPSVFPYQPAGLWEESGTNKKYNQSSGDGLYRRSLYTYWRRTSPPPSMLSFDATSREVCTARRERTSTPLQALVLLNDPQYVEAARLLADKLQASHGPSADSCLAVAFRTLTSRVPSAAELAVLQRMYEEQLQRFRRSPMDASQLFEVGEMPGNKDWDAAQRAALTIVNLTLLSHDECVTKR